MKRKQERYDRGEQYARLIPKDTQMAGVVERMQFSRQDAVALASCYVLAPALGGFVRWLLQEAVQSGKKRLYFLARDGYFMYHAALQLCKALDLPIECRYLSVSRYSLRLPLFHSNREEALNYICRGGLETTLQRILARGGLSEEEQKEVAQQLTLSIPQHQALSYPQLFQIRRALNDCELFWSLVDMHSQSAWIGLAGYLKQEGLLEEAKFAIVDSGWVGSMQKTLGEALGRLGHTGKLEGYYWGLYELPPEADQTAYHCYYFRPGKDLRKKVYFNNCLFEAVFTAPHGMTLCYQCDQGEYKPCYASISPDQLAFVQKLEGYFMQYMKLLAEQLQRSLRDDLKREKRTIQKLLRLLMSEPSPQEAERFGSLPFSDDVLVGGEGQLARLLTEEELKENGVGNRLKAAAGLHAKPIKESAWFEGSVIRSGEKTKRRRKGYVYYQYLRQLRRRLYCIKERGKKKNG